MILFPEIVFFAKRHGGVFFRESSQKLWGMIFNRENVVIFAKRHRGVFFMFFSPKTGRRRAEGSVFGYVPKVVLATPRRYITKKVIPNGFAKLPESLVV